MISTPGHTAGHQSLFVDLKDSGPVIVSGDFHVLREGREQRRISPYNADSAHSIASMIKIERLIEELGAELWIGHELAAFDALKKAPDFYE